MTLDLSSVPLWVAVVVVLLPVLVSAGITYGNNRRVARKNEFDILKDAYETAQATNLVEINTLKQTNKDIAADNKLAWAEQTKLRGENATLTLALAANKAECERRISELEKQLTVLMTKIQAPAPATQAAPGKVVIVGAEVTVPVAVQEKALTGGAAPPAEPEPSQ